MGRSLKARIYVPILARSALESVLELAVSSARLAAYSTNYVILGHLPLSNMFNILELTETADGNRATNAVGHWQTVQVGMGLDALPCAWPWPALALHMPGSETYSGAPLLALLSLKARTHTPTFAESAIESALESVNSSSESVDSSADRPVGM